MKAQLSDIQKTVLTLAYENRLDDARATQGQQLDVLTSEIFAVHYLAPAGYMQYSEIEECWLSVSEWRERLRDPQGQKSYSKWYYGKMFNKTKREIKRALERLERRGLITFQEQYWSGWGGAKLTEAGYTLAESLFGKQQATATTVTA